MKKTKEKERERGKKEGEGGLESVKQNTSKQQTNILQLAFLNSNPFELM